MADAQSYRRVVFRPDQVLAEGDCQALLATAVQCLVIQVVKAFW